MSDTDSTTRTDTRNAIEGEDGPENIDEIDPDDESDVERAARETPPGRPLRVTNLRKEFGGLTAVDDASFDVEAGSLTGLIGPNGAGKSTTFDCITGVHHPTSGSVHLHDEEITGLQPYQIADRGLVRTFQIARELEEMTVLENMMLAPRAQRGESLWRSVLPGARGAFATRNANSASGRGRRSISSRSTTSPRNMQETSRAASESSSRWRGRYSPIPRSSCSTNRSRG